MILVIRGTKEQNKITKQKQTYREQTDSCQREGALGDWRKQTKQNKTKLIDINNNMVITRGKEGWGEVEDSKGGVNGDGKRLDSVY